MFVTARWILRNASKDIEGPDETEHADFNPRCLHKRVVQKVLPLIGFLGFIPGIF